MVKIFNMKKTESLSIHPSFHTSIPHQNSLKRILIAGASGQLAKEFIKNFEELNIDFLAPSEQEFDITDKIKIENVFSQYKPDVIINCAAYNNVEAAETDNTKAFLINRDAVINLVEASSKYNTKLVHFSSDYVFDGKKGSVYTEDDAVNPLNEYGKSKLAGEQAALKYNNSLVCRLSWVIGDGQQNFLYKLSGWLKNNKVIKVSSDEISVPTFTLDIVDVILNALDKNLTGLYQLVNSGRASRYELAKEYVKLKNLDNEIVPVPMSTFPSKVQRPLFTAMSNEKISKILDISIPDWKESLAKFCQKF